MAPEPHKKSTFEKNLAVTPHKKDLATPWRRRGVEDHDAMKKKGSAVLFPWLLVYYCCCFASSNHATILQCRAFSLSFQLRRPRRLARRLVPVNHHANIIDSSSLFSSLSLTTQSNEQQDNTTPKLSAPVATHPTSTKNVTTQKNQDLVDESSSSIVLTSILLKISYDGSRFSGWSAGNVLQDNPKINQSITHPPRSSRRRRNRHLYSAGTAGNNIRSVQGVLQAALAKVYGNIPPDRVVVEGASRTDKGVHAVGMVAHVYALTNNNNTTNNYTNGQNQNDTTTTTTTVSTIPGKRLPHPRSDTDTTGFASLPMAPAQLAFTLNRMLPNDVRVTAYARLPTRNHDNNGTTTTTTRSFFHASQSATAKTYSYTVAAGPRADPTLARSTWYTGTTPLSFHTTEVQETIALLTAQAYTFQAFAGAPRGRDDQRKRAATAWRTCRLYHIDIHQIAAAQQHLWCNTDTYVISITGDRFLYKMMRFLVGTLVGVATGQVTPLLVQNMLETEQRGNNMLVCAPAHGLVLQKVHYDQNDDLEWHLANS